MGNYGAVNKPGMHRKYLAEECKRVTGQHVPGLMLVPSLDAR